MNICAQASTVYYENYDSPFSSRYGSAEMRGLFSPQTKFSTWRQIWIALAQAQKELGLPISDEQIAEMEAHIHDIDFAVADRIEREIKHDVMSHVRTFGEVCPLAKPIIHLGATSCLVTDNTDVFITAKALECVKKKLLIVIGHLAEKADLYKEMPCLSFTHYQAAQPTTVGKRYALWLNDFVLALKDVQFRLDNLCCLGIKGATGTQSSFLELFRGDHAKVKELERLTMEKLGFKKVYIIAGQTYSRLQDVGVLSALNMVAIAAHKMCTDLRLLAHDKEIEEPFGKRQVGSSAMPYKRNPEGNERNCALSRIVMSHHQTLTMNAANQWLERTLDDSANRRVAIPESFLAVDAILDSLANIAKNSVVNQEVIAQNLREELPFMAVENILMYLVERGGDRQDLHEKLRQLSQEAGDNVKRHGLKNDLLERIAKDPELNISKEELNKIVDVRNFIGRAPEQVTEFLREVGF